MYFSCILVFIHLITMWQGSWAGVEALCVEVECCHTIALSAWCSTHQLPGCKCTGKSFAHHLGVYILYIWVHMAICSHIYMFLTIYIRYINLYRSLGSYSIASYSHFGLHRLGLALHTNIQAYIYIYIYWLHFVCKPLYRHIYI